MKHIESSSDLRSKSPTFGMVLFVLGLISIVSGIYISRDSLFLAGLMLVGFGLITMSQSSAR